MAGRWRCGALVLPPLWPVALAGLPWPRGAVLSWRRGLGPCLRGCVTTLGASLLLGGGAEALMRRGVSAPVALLASAGVAALVYLLATLLPNAMCDVRQVELRVDGNAVILPAMLDSGNLLRDPVTGLPVLVVPRRAAGLLFPDIGDRIDLSACPRAFACSMCARPRARRASDVQARRVPSLPQRPSARGAGCWWRSRAPSTAARRRWCPWPRFRHPFPDKYWPAQAGARRNTT